MEIFVTHDGQNGRHEFVDGDGTLITVYGETRLFELGPKEVTMRPLNTEGTEWELVARKDAEEYLDALEEIARLMDDPSAPDADVRRAAARALVAL